MSHTTLILGCGELGRRVARLLRRRGERVLGTMRTPARAADLRSQGIEPILFDVLECSAGGNDALPQVDRVFHAIGYDRASKVPIHQVYVEGLTAALGCLPDPTRVLVFASSTGVYGDAGGGWVDEETLATAASESGRACFEAEEVLRRSGRPMAILRYGGLYGPERQPYRRMVSLAEPIAADPEGYLNMIHLDDAAMAAVAALDRAAPGSLFNVVDDQPVTRRAYAECLARSLGAPTPRFEGAAAGAERGDKRVCNRRIKEALGVSWRYPDIHAGLPAAIAAERFGADLA